MNVISGDTNELKFYTKLSQQPKPVSLLCSALLSSNILNVSFLSELNQWFFVIFIRLLLFSNLHVVSCDAHPKIWVMQDQQAATKLLFL